MPICTKCHEEIDHLKHTVAGWITWDFDGENFTDYEFTSSFQQYDYRCPKCEEVLAGTDEEAMEFFGVKQAERAAVLSGKV